ncbi:MAG: hypothetical protein KF889_25495 [Alphaproteobacteria bacterium]|nr:hypothetical protein [Alphaproteobacteria bacterium]MCW5739650.1 hypothetical protein [Alphaproteobacteria bacterium]
MPEPHAITRARQRYGLELTGADLDRITADVAAGKSLHLSTQPDSSQRHAVLVGKTALIAVVAPGGHVITVLPRKRRK